MSRRLDPAGPLHNERSAWLFATCFGGFLGLCLLKFGNPPIMEKWVTAPNDIYEFFLGSPWPITWAYVLVLVLAAMSLLVGRWRIPAPAWLTGLLVAWFLCLCLSSLRTADPGLTKPTLAHLFVCVVCFFAGVFSSAAPTRPTWVLPGLFCALLLVIAVGWEQHFGGLEQTRRYFFLYIYPKLKEAPPDYLKKISSTRIFSTLFYPNALAGAILLLLPVSLEFIWQARRRFTLAARVFLVNAVAIGALACLYWSGSKGGWLLMLVLGLIWLLRLSFDVRLKRALLGLILVVGLAGFAWRYAAFFQKGATSVTARFDYWRAAVQTALARPLTGTGPGTFAIAYAKVKRPESEMSRLVHNDYLEQASDSGVPAFVAYAAFIVGVLVVARPNRSRTASTNQAREPARGMGQEGTGEEDSILFAMWLGLLGWALQGIMEFSLYIPGLAWPAFAFMGILLGRSRPPAEEMQS